MSENIPRRPDALLVDDHNDALISMRELLVLLGYNVTAAGSGPVALAKAAERPPQVVLLDLRMPGMDGFEVARKLREIPGMDKALLIAVTGSFDDEDLARGRAAGFNAFLAKPVDMDLLEEMLRNHELTAR
jgi:CheY-like chemotaxis protein